MDSEAPPRDVYLALGSNIDPESHLPRAVAELDHAVGVVAVSRVYEAEPVGAPDTPPFLNAAVLVRTSLPPHRLKLEILRPLEARLGRVRTSDPNAPRTIDIDIALVEDLSLCDPEAGILVPDPDIPRCAHLALPLADLSGALRHPAFGRTLAELASGFAEDPGIRERRDLRLASIGCGG